MLERRAFLKTLGGLFVAAAAPTKTYAFFGNILRPKPREIALPMYSVVWHTGPVNWATFNVVKGYGAITLVEDLERDGNWVVKEIRESE